MKTLIDALKVMISETFSCVSSPIQHAAFTAYHEYKKIKPYLIACAKVHEIAGCYLHQRFLEMGLTCPKPEGAFYLFPNFTPFTEALKKIGIKNSVQLADQILEKSQVAILPGIDFYRENSELTMRVASIDYNGPVALKAYQQELNQDEIIKKHMPNLIEGCDRLAQWLTNI